MKRPITITLFAILIISLLVASFAVSPVQAAYDSGRRGPTGNRGQRVLSQSTTAVVLTDQEKIDLGEAIREEYTAMNTYLGISKEYGDNALFARIARSEQQHVNALIQWQNVMALKVPETPVKSPKSSGQPMLKPVSLASNSKNLMPAVR